MSFKIEQTFSSNRQQLFPFMAGLLFCTVSLFPLLSLAQAASARASSGNESTPLAFTRVTVIDTAGGPSRPDMTVVVTGNRITALGKASKITVPKGAQVVDATGKFLIPGLWDMHAHAAFTRGMYESRNPLLIANGVTGIRDMGSSLDMINEWRAKIASGKMIGPRIVAAGPILDGPGTRFTGLEFKGNPPGMEGNIYTIVSTPAEARQDVDTLKREGSNFIKVYEMLRPDVYHAIANEAKKQGLAFAGHVPYFMTATEASNAGQKSIEHMMDMVLSTSSREAELRKELPVPTKDDLQYYAARARVEAEGIASYSAPKAKALFALFVKNGTWQCPTLIVLRNDLAYSDDPSVVDTSRVRYLERYMSPSSVKSWKSIHPKPELSSEEKKIYRAEFVMVGPMERAGVGILAGSDMGNPYVFPGFALHDEMALMVQAGLTPMQALQTATINPARYLGREKELGSVNVGKFADLVLLNADPLADIRNTERIDAVVVDGRYLPKSALQKMLDDEATAVAKLK